MGDLNRGVLEGCTDLVRIWDVVRDGVAFGVEGGSPSEKFSLALYVAAILMRGVLA